jgi:chemosensory pili system protein ChpC
MEEAIAPQQREDHEVMLGELDSAIARVLLLGASADSTDAVCEFLRALPKGLRLTVLHTQHHAFDAADALAQRLKDHTSMPVRVAGRDSRTRMGEFLFVPAGQQVRLMRDGRIESHVVDGAAPQQPSIDASFTTAAGVFGRDAIAIVFAGNATDAVAGAQAVYDRGGQVWVESAPGDHYAGMVRGIEAERLVSFSGTPQESPTMSEQPLPREIRCVLVPVGNLRLLLPNATVAEVITLPTAEHVDDAPEWVLGRIAWRGWRVPLISFTKLAGAQEADSELSVRVAVLKALGGNPKLPFIAVVTQGFPRLTTLNAELIIPTHDGTPLPPGVKAEVLVRDDVAVIPDLEGIEAELAEMLELAS